MAYHFVRIPGRGCAETESELNSFLRSRRVVSTDRRWVDAGENSYWAVCVDYVESARPTSPGDRVDGRERKDYREVLSAEEFAVFSKLRQLRKELAESTSVPVYAVFTNEQLARIVQSTADSGQSFRRLGAGNPGGTGSSSFHASCKWFVCNDLRSPLRAAVGDRG